MPVLLRFDPEALVKIGLSFLSCHSSAVIPRLDRGIQKLARFILDPAIKSRDDSGRRFAVESRDDSERRFAVESRDDSERRFAIKSRDDTKP